MEALTALSVAGVVIQFVDFSSKLLSNSRQLYRSADGITTETVDLKLITTDLNTLLQSLTRKLPENRPISKSTSSSDQLEEDAAIDHLCKRCVEIAEELIVRVNKLKLKPQDEKRTHDGEGSNSPNQGQNKPSSSGKEAPKFDLKKQWNQLVEASESKCEGYFRKWNSFRKALEASWNKSDIEALASTLREFRSEIEFRILIKFRTALNDIVLQQSQFSHQLTQSTQMILDGFMNSRDDLANQVRLQSERLIAAQRYGKTKTPQDMEEFLRGKLRVAGTLHSPSGIGQGHETIPGPTARNHEVEEQLRLLIIENGILRSLSFSTLTDRKESLETPYQQTFQWVFEEPGTTERPWSSFVSWLQEGTGIYWINGKAGSGKSTLMRYIYDDPRTTAYLKEWAGSTPHEICGFFFWNSGDEDQKSQGGLLRSLLFEILQRHRDLLSDVMPEVWSIWSARATATVCSKLPLDSPFIPPEPKPWTMVQLKRTFRAVLQFLQNKVKLCLFIDGLDEYDGDYSDLVELFQEYAQCPNIKVCLSSRPLLVFENEFAGLPSLKLQDLTHGDISHYVKDKLYRHRHMVQLAKQRTADVTDLVDEIVTKAQGVFLWVKLVVKSLLRGLSDYNRMSDLQKRVKHLPEDLEALYAHMLKTTDPFYHEQASQIFQIVRVAQKHSPSRLTLLHLSWADDEDEKLAESAPIKPLSEDEVIERCQMMDARLKSVCSGLLESLDNQFSDIAPDAKVVYLHRTVSDWLAQPSVWNKVVSHTAGTSFSPNLSMLRSCLMQLKTAVVSPRMPLEMNIITSALQFAQGAELDLNQGFPKLLDQLDFAASCQWRIGNGKTTVELNPELRSREPVKSGQACTGGLVSAVPNPGGGHWFCGIEIAGVKPLGHRSTFYNLAKDLGLHHYVSIKYESGVIADQDVNQHLLIHAVTHTRYPDLDSIRNILRNGVDPNFAFEGASPWEHVLLRATAHFTESPPDRLDGGAKHSRDAEWRQKARHWAGVIKIFVDHGANPTMVTRRSQNVYKHPRISLLIVLERFFPDFLTKEADELRLMLEKRGTSVGNETRTTESNPNDEVIVCGPAETTEATNEAKKYNRVSEVVWDLVNEWYPGIAMRKGCVLCGSQENKAGSWPYSMAYRPDLSDIRLLSLDGGGVRGIIQPSILARLELLIDLDIPFGEFFDLIVGTSAGGLTALGFGVHNFSVQECITHFKALCENRFDNAPGAKIQVYGWLIKLFVPSIYKTEPLENAMKSIFGQKTLFGHRVNASRVAVTTTVGTESYLLANYHWENNPVGVAVNETKTIWGQNVSFDVIVSLGCAEAKNPQNQPRQFFMVPNSLTHLFQTFFRTMNGNSACEKFSSSVNNELLDRCSRLTVRFQQTREPDLDDVNAIAEMEQLATLYRFHYQQPKGNFFPVWGQPSDELEARAHRLMGSVFFFELKPIKQHEEVSIVKGWICCRLPPGTECHRRLIKRTSHFLVTNQKVHVPTLRDDERLWLEVSFHQQDSLDSEPLRIDVNFDCAYALSISGFPMTLEKLKSHWEMK